MTYQNKNQDARDLGGLLVCISLIALLLGGCTSARRSLRHAGELYSQDFDAYVTCVNPPTIADAEHPSWAPYQDSRTYDEKAAECNHLIPCECTTDIDCETRCGGSY